MSLRDFDMTAKNYDELLEAQGGVCAICGRKPKTDQRFAVDHDHRTGLVRGLLCPVRCNYSLLGQFNDDAKLFRAAADYLDCPPATNVFVKYHKSAPPRRPSKGA